MELEGAARASARRGKNKEKSLFFKKKKSQDDPTRKKEINKERLACLGGGVNRIFHVFLRRTTALWAKKTRNEWDLLLEM